MNHTRTLTILSLFSVLLGSFHLSDDIVRGFEPGGTSNFNGALILAAVLLASLMLEGRRWAHAVVLIGSLGIAAVSYLHMMGSGLVGPRVVNSGSVFFWVWTLMAMGAAGSTGVVLSALGLWKLRRGRSAL